MNVMSEAVSQQAANQTRLSFGLALTSMAASDESIVAISADTLDLIGLREFLKLYP